MNFMDYLMILLISVAFLSFFIFVLSLVWLTITTISMDIVGYDATDAIYATKIAIGSSIIGTLCIIGIGLIVFLA